MFKGKVSAKLAGTLILPSIGNRAYAPGADVYFTEEQFHKPDVQNAIKKKQLVLVGAGPKAIKMQKVSNTTTASLVLPGYGVVRVGGSMEIKADDLKKPDIDRLIRSGKLTTGKVSIEEKEEVSPVDQKMNAKVHKPKSDLLENEVKPQKKKKGVRPLHVKDNDLLDIENGVEPGEKDGITFVDIEQAEARLANHPTLGKLKGKNK